MALSLVTPPAVEPVSLADAKLHLRVTGTDEDTLITTLIAAAREYSETFTHRAFITQTWDLKVDAFPPRADVIWLPKAPLVSVTSVSYVDANGVTQTWSASLYSVDVPVGPKARVGCLVPNYGQSFPSTRGVNGVTIRFVAGYGAAAADVPASLKAAMKILIGTWFAPGRESISLGNSATLIPHTVDALLWPFKAF